MGTVRIGGIVKSSPSTQFWLEADWVQTDSANNRSLLRVWLRAANGPSGLIGSNFLAEGYQNAHANGYLFEVRRNPFLPSGFTQNQQRWHESADRWFSHNGDGNGPSVSLAMELGYGDINDRGDNGRWHTGSIGAPARIPRAPGAAGTPSASGITPIGASITWGAASRGHANIVEYQIQRATNSAFTSGVVTVGTGTSRSHSPTNLTPATRYWWRARARNADGWGAWSGAMSFETLGGGRIKHAGAWVNATPWLKSGGAWSRSRPWQKQGGVWVPLR